MTLADIESLVSNGESESLELKASTGELRTGVRSVCAMLNHRGGTVLFGVDPDGRIIGQFASDHTLEKVSAELRKLEPPAYPSVSRVAVQFGKEIVAITVSSVSFLVISGGWQSE